MNNIDLEINVYILKIFFINICTYYTFLKIINKEFSHSICVFLSTVVISIISSILKYQINHFTSIICLILLLSGLYSIISKNKFGFSILNTILALSINYILFFISIIIIYIPNRIFNIHNEFVSLIFMMIIHIILLISIFKTRKFKDGFIFLKNKAKDEYFDLLILNISISILFLTIATTSMDFIFLQKLFVFFVAFTIIMVISIQKTLTMYYKHKLLVTELEETKSELKKKNEEIAKLEEENLNFSKTSHSIAHKIKSLEYKLNELMLKNEISSEIDIKDRIDNISNQCFNHTAIIELSKTNIPEIDDMLSYMQSECTNNNIDFDLQLHGNIYTMTNNFISKEDLEILLADHIKNAIIAINYSDNLNRSILVRLGMIDGYYSVFVYDSGIEFEIDTLTHLGQKPSTTHSDSGGTGMGFMNTFDTLRKYQASLYINENGAPTADDFTKSIVIKFDKQNKFEIHSYRAEKIENINNNLIIKNK